MATRAVTSVNCPNCHTPFTAPIQQIFDAQADPEVKSRLLSGQLNLVLCPHCGFRGALNVPFLYNDAELELALVFMPMELGMSDADRQRAIGDLTNRVMQQLPPDARKGYLLQPRIFFTVQSLIDAMLERDEATRELVETQRRKMELIEELRKIDPDDSLAMAEFIGRNDAELDESFFQLLDIMMGIAEAQGDAGERDRLVKHQASLLDKSTVGQTFKSQQAAIEALTASPTRETLIEQLIAAEEGTVREALVVVGRHLLDYAFFQALTARIDAAGSAGDQVTRDKLIALRKEVQEIRDQVDAMAMAVLDERAALLRELIVADDPRETIKQRIFEIDNAFFGVLSTNIREAESAGRQDVVQSLSKIGDMAIEVLNETAPPEVKLINRLASAENNEQVRQLLEKEREHLNQDFLGLVERALAGLRQGRRQDDFERLRYAAERIKEMIAV